MNESTDIRRAGPDDAKLILTMIRELAGYQDEGEYITVTVDQWRELLGRDDVIVLVAERAGEAMGYVSALRRPQLWSGEDILALDDLYVREQYRDGGIGRALMFELARHALPEGLTISWGMRPENVDGQRFYARLGATFRPKVVAAWPVASYSSAISR
ncbi:GNAT family N-acetyltransferase [Kribbella deserti]|uniref:GNAT family N-acetyltransferase n=1 Tax=Kribbella deserti TaxID=1926257 RepID=A0ABV6QKL9_9ACTN